MLPQIQKRYGAKVCNKYFIVLFLTLVFVFFSFSSIKASAAQYGNITIVMQDVQTNSPVGGGNLVYYKVADTQVSYLQVKYQYTAEFADMAADIQTESQSQVLTAEKAREYYAHITEKGISGVTLEIGADGKVKLENIETGLYLVVQTVAAQGYEKAIPFCVSLPFERAGGIYYSLVSYPKASQIPGEQPPPSPPETSNGEELPKTGQLDWPIPVLSTLGVLLFLLGWAIRQENVLDEETE